MLSSEISALLVSLFSVLFSFSISEDKLIEKNINKEKVKLVDNL